MPTSPEFKALLQPLLKRRSDLAFTRRILFFQPLTHYLRGVVFVHVGSWGGADLVAFATPLFDGQYNTPDFQAGDGVYSFYRAHWKQQDPEELSLELCDRLEREALPAVERITDPREHEASGPYFDHYSETERIHATFHFRMALGACYYGDYARARDVTILYEHRHKVQSPLMKEPVTEEFKHAMHPRKRALYLAKMLRENEAGVPQLLHDWERYSVETIKLTKWWTPTPFPCEEKRAG